MGHSRSSFSSQKNPGRQGHTAVERVISQLCTYLDNHRNDAKDKLRAWETNGKSPFKHPLSLRCPFIFLICFIVADC